MFCERITSKNGFMTANERVESGSKGVKVDQKASGDGIFILHLTNERSS